MAAVAQITVSLATWKAIEQQRLSFDEDHDAIIRRALVLKASRQKTATRAAFAPAPIVSRKHGNLSVIVHGRVTKVANLKFAYIAILSQLVKVRPSLFQQLLPEGNQRRRWIAMKPEALFPLSPHLARQHAHRIAPDWYVDTNVSRAQIEARCKRAAEIAGLDWGNSVKIDG